MPNPTVHKTGFSSGYFNIIIPRFVELGIILFFNVLTKQKDLLIMQMVIY